MDLFGKKSQKRIRQLEAENRKLKRLCSEKDSFFKELMSDALRHGSPLAAKHMTDRKKYLKGK